LSPQKRRETAKISRQNGRGQNSQTETNRAASARAGPATKPAGLLEQRRGRELPGKSQPGRYSKTSMETAAPIIANKDAAEE
jgi:hypothetical protein